MRNILSYGCVIALCLFSCKSDLDRRLSPDEMKKLLFDVHLAETYSMVVSRDTLHPRTERNLDSLARYYQLILKHHKVTLVQFEQNLDWYKRHPEELDSIYTKMIPEASRIEGLVE